MKEFWTSAARELGSRALTFADDTTNPGALLAAGGPDDVTCSQDVDEQNFDPVSPQVIPRYNLLIGEHELLSMVAES